MATGQHLRLRCFLEGIEVPVVSASVSIQPDAPAQCQLQIPATDKAHQFLPRTMVHVFFIDYYDGPTDVSGPTSGEEAPQVSTSDEAAAAENQEADTAFDTAFRDGDDWDREVEQSGTGGSGFETAEAARARRVGSVEDYDAELAEHNAGPTATPELRGDEEEEAEEPDIADSRWKLLFCGEIMGYQFMKSSMQRSIVLDCMDLSVYWDTCYQYQVNVASLHGNATAHFVGAGTTLFDTFFQSSTSTIVDVVNQRSRARPELTGLLSGVVHLLERVGGVYSRQGFRGVNDFFTMAELRYHLIDMLGASEDDNSSQRLFPRRAFNRWARGRAGRLGKIASFREILNLLNQFIFHNTVPCPVARYSPPRQEERTTTRRVTTTEQFSDTADWRELNDQIQSHRQTLNSYAYNTETLRPNHMAPRLERLTGAVRATKDEVATHSSAYGLRNTVDHLYRAGREIRALATTLARDENGASASARTKRYRDFFSEADPSAKLDEARSQLQSAVQTMDGGSRTRSGSVDRTDEVSYAGRLYSQIIRPDIFMCAPPRCNILFPELYSQLQFSRQYMREVSRMRLTVSDEIFGRDALLNSVYFAPDVEVLGSRMRQGRAGSAEGATLARAAYARRLMEHELFTGPIPVFERMNEVNIAAARGQPTAVRGARVPYAMRAANFQFFKNRWASRSMQVSGKFNPWAVCGFPAVVIDRYMTEDQLILSGLRGQRFLEEAAESNYPGIVRGEGDTLTAGDEWGALEAWDILRNTVPTQFVGLIMGLNHNINQNSASTSYTFAAPRTHRDNDELLGANRLQTSGTRGEVIGSTTTEFGATRAGATFRSQIEQHLSVLEGYANSSDRVRDPALAGRMRRLAGGIRGTKDGITSAAAAYNMQAAVQSLLQAERSVSTMARLLDRFVSTGNQQFFSGQGREHVASARSHLRESIATIDGASRTRVRRGEGTAAEDVDIPLEDFVRPPWMADVWANNKIGAVYQQFFGTGATTDPIVIDTGYTTAMDTADADAERADADAPETDAPSARADGSMAAGVNFSEDTSEFESTEHRTERIEQTEEMAITVERSIDLLLRAYSAIKHQPGMDVQEFIRAYTWRPVATMTEMLGGRDLTINSQTGETSGQEGFHSRAFGSGENGRNLRNMLPPDTEGQPVRRILGISTESTRLEGGREAELSDEERQRANDALVRLDTRADKSDRVLDYVSDLWASKGQLG